MQRERKVVTVLFADLVGFTSRAESLDPEDVEAILRPYHERLRSELERHGGTVEKFIGDAVMALFGAPAAHEDDPERAVRAALAIRDWAREEAELEVRIGITTGEALVTLGARPEAGEGMASGDIVNTAARLQAGAAANGVLVDETTQRATKHAIQYREAEPVSAKGKAEPVAVWEAVEARSRFGVDVGQGGAPLVGRRRELDLLADALERAKHDRSTQLVTLVGVPGIGKSRLAYELSQIVEAEPELVYWRQGRSLPYGEGVTYWALAEMAKAQAGILETDTPDEVDRKLADAVAALEVEGAARMLESLRPLVGLAGEADAGSDRSERFAAWRGFFEALAEQRATVLVFEDLHWADDDLLDFVDHLVDWSSGVRLLVVCTARPELLERRPGWGGGKPNALTLSISPLSDEDTARLLAELLERAVLPAETQASLLARAGGNPLYAEQFARLLVEGGHHEELPLPENVQGIIAARLDGLASEEKQLLQDAAVLGKVFWLGAVSAVGGLERQRAEEWLHSLERKEFVRRERRSSVSGEDEYAFRHLLVRDVAYGQIPRGARAERHERAAAWIDALGRPEDHAEMLAHHYLEALELRRASGAEQPASLVESARFAARDAGDRALALRSFTAARRFYEAALDLWPPDDEQRFELLLAYARSRVDDDALDDWVLADAAEGLLREGKIEAAAEAEARQGGIWLNRGDRAQAFEHLERGRRLVEERATSPEKAYVLQELARAMMMADDERAIGLATESLRLAEEMGIDASRARNLNTLGCAKVTLMGDPSGLDDLERAAAIGAAANSHEEVSALANLQTMVGLFGDVRRAAEIQEQTLASARRQGLAGFIRWQEAELAIARYLRGYWTAALAISDEFIDAAEAGSPHYMESVCRYVRGAVKLARGEIEAAVADARRGTEVARSVLDPQSLHPAVAFEARAELAAGNARTAQALADELLELWGERGVRPQLESVDGSWVLVDLGRESELVEAIERAPAKMLWHEGARRIASGDFVGAAEIYLEIGSVPDELYARLRGAEQLVGEGRRSDADAQLRLVLPVISDLGATAWQAEAEALLAASA